MPTPVNPAPTGAARSLPGPEAGRLRRAVRSTPASLRPVNPARGLRRPFRSTPASLRPVNPARGLRRPFGSTPASLRPANPARGLRRPFGSTPASLRQGRPTGRPRRRPGAGPRIRPLTDARRLTLLVGTATPVVPAPLRSAIMTVPGHAGNDAGRATSQPRRYPGAPERGGYAGPSPYGSRDARPDRAGGRAASSTGRYQDGDA